MHHAHACAAKQSKLVKRYIATTALFALRYILLPGRSVVPICSTSLACLFKCFSQINIKLYLNTFRLRSFNYRNYLEKNCLKFLIIVWKSSLFPFFHCKIAYHTGMLVYKINNKFTKRLINIRLECLDFLNRNTGSIEINF